MLSIREKTPLFDKAGLNRGRNLFARRAGDGAALSPGYPGIRLAPVLEQQRGPVRFLRPSGANSRQSVAILGAGNGGLALAGFLAKSGHRVTLWNRSPARIIPVAALGGIQVTLPGSVPTLTRLAQAT